jgi:hypothetical protein
MQGRMILAVFFLAFNIIALLSQSSKYKKLGRDADGADDPEEKAAFKKAQAKMIPNMVLLGIGAVLLVFLFFYYFSAPTP